MLPSKKKFTTIDEYISTFPTDIQEILQKVRRIIQQAAPNATETISYQIPCFNFNGTYLIYFAGYKNHIALYPITRSMESLGEELRPFVKGKGTLQFPLKNPIPYALIEKIVATRLKELQAQGSTSA